MLQLFKRLLWDETAAVGLIRALCLGLGGAAATGQLDGILPGLPDWVGIALLGMGGWVRSSAAKAAPPASPVEPKP